MILTDLHKYTRLSYDQHNIHMCTSLVINMTYTDVHNNWCPKIIILGPIYRHRPDQYRSYTIAIPLLKWPYNQTVPSQTMVPRDAKMDTIFGHFWTSWDRPGPTL